MQYTQSFGEAVSAKSRLEIAHICGFKETVSNCIFNIEQIECLRTAIFYFYFLFKKPKIPLNSWLYYPSFFSLSIVTLHQFPLVTFTLLLC